MKGALEEVLKHCSTLYPSSSQLTDRDRDHFEAVAANMGRHGLRGMHSFLPFSYSSSSSSSSSSSVVALAVGHDLTSMTFVGMMAMWDSPRVGVASSVKQLMDGGVEVKMITGDAQETAESIGENRQLDKQTSTEHLVFLLAHSLGISSVGSLSLSGEELDQLSSHPKQLQASVQQATVFYRVTPRHKVIIVKVSPPPPPPPPIPPLPPPIPPPPPLLPLLSSECCRPSRQWVR